MEVRCRFTPTTGSLKVFFPTVFVTAFIFQISAIIPPEK